MRVMRWIRSKGGLRAPVMSEGQGQGTEGEGYGAEGAEKGGSECRA